MNDEKSSVSHKKVFKTTPYKDDLSSPEISRSKLSMKHFKRRIISDSDDSDTDTAPKNSLPNHVDKHAPDEKISSPAKGWTGPDYKLNLKPLGFDKNLDKWIESTKAEPVISSSLSSAVSCQK